MINLLRRFVTGYSKATKSFNGKEYQFSFSDKAVFFDPLFMIKEFKSREEETNLRDLDATVTFDSLLHKCPRLPEDAAPTVICKIKLDGKLLTVSRYIFKDGIYPVSQYLFEINQELVGQFSRIYDYGHLVGKYALSLDGAFLEKDPNQTSWKWVSPSGPTVVVEKFGHTQIWCWNGSVGEFR